MASHKSLNWILSLCLLLTACRSFASPSPTPAPAFEPTSLPDTPTPAPDYVTRLMNAEYQLGLTDALRVVQLTDGKFEQGAPGGVDYISASLTGFAARGDLDGDDRNEYAALVSENYGGTGVFVFLVVFDDVDGKPTFRTSALVDDRPLLNDLSIAGGQIFLDAAIHKSDDPMCCPTLRTTRHYRLIHNQLKMTDYVTFTPDGRPRAIAIESPADGTEVFKSVPIRGSVTIAPFENNLIYGIYDAGGILLSEGHITVDAPDHGAPGAFEQTILLGNFLSGTVIRIRVQDFNQEDGSLFAMDSVELVVK